MNLGLGTLHDVKGLVLPEAVRDQTEYDAILAAMGRGVAAQLDRHCGRRFARAEFDTAEFDADLIRYYLPRAPVERLVKVERLGLDGEPFGAVWQWAGGDADGAEDLRPHVRLDKASGMVRLSETIRLYTLPDPGFDTPRLRVTYSGGYWFEEHEPGESLYPSAAPAGATPLPEDVRLAWLLQTQYAFECKDHLLPKGLKGDKELMVSTGDLRLTKGVAELLQPYRRYQLL